VSGTVLDSLPQILVIDDGDAGFSSTSGWSTYAGAGNQNDFIYTLAGSGSETADWTFSGLAPGEYRVWVTWEAYTNRAVDASYTVLDGGTTLATMAVNQQLPPADLFADQAWWQDLGGVYPISGDTLVVRLSDLASQGKVIGDAVRVERVGGLP
jgi:hypothetical protein